MKTHGKIVGLSEEKRRGGERGGRASIGRTKTKKGAGVHAILN